MVSKNAHPDKRLCPIGTYKARVMNCAIHEFTAMDQATHKMVEGNCWDMTFRIHGSDIHCYSYDYFPLGTLCLVNVKHAAGPGGRMYATIPTIKELKETADPNKS